VVQYHNTNEDAQRMSILITFLMASQNWLASNAKSSQHAHVSYLQAKASKEIAYRAVRLSH